MLRTCKLTLLAALLLTLLTGCAAPSAPAPTLAPSATPASQPAEMPANTLFDDFHYTTRDEMTAHGWIIRAKAGWPGIPGATFRPENVTFLDDPETPDNRLLRMTSSTDGTAANTFQTQLCHQRKYFEGTYAARVYFNNAPVTGPDGDQVVETFYAITPYEEPLKPEYSEMDFEYLPNGGWGAPPLSFMFTTWETVQIEPWQADNASESQVSDFSGWHTLVVQAMDGKVRYFVDDKQLAEHSGNYYPDARMSLNFNLWFIVDGQVQSTEVRTYQEDLDWVYYQAGVALSPAQVLEKVNSLREGNPPYVDTVPAGSPPLPSLCDL